jgi:ferredoxin
MVRTEGLDFEQTMEALRTYIQSNDATSITLVLKRLVFRESVEVSLSYAPSTEEKEKSGAEAWTQSLSMLCGSQLRKELLRSGLPVYDKKTLRFDQPYVTGDCGGEGICGTCLVQVLEGKELLNEPDAIEEMVTRKWGAANWRLSCRVVVGATNAPGVVRLRLMPQAPFIRKR